MKGAPRSEIYDDVYFSVDDGLAETRHVFLQGNNLLEHWRGRDQFTICETGFGTGLNFLAVWKLYDETPQTQRPEKLHFISFEKHPMDVMAMRNALEPWAEEFGERVEKMVAGYPLLIAGCHRVVLTPQITLTIIFDDVNETIQDLQAQTDCWFLDGFTPAKNPEMWSETLFQNMARLSVQGTTFSTFTAAGFVKRGLQDAGFEVSKCDGFGRKREMLIGVYHDAQSEGCT